MAGKVMIENIPVTKAGFLVLPGTKITVKEPDHPYVSRGGVKLAGALEDFGLSPAGRVAIDVGISTGGFTDCLLKGGAKKVFGIDVGYGQVAMSVRKNPRVVLFERTNFRHFEPDLLDEKADLAVMDVSFISLTLLLPKLKDCLSANADCLLMVKPQFELDRGLVGKGGVVREDHLRMEAVERVEKSAIKLGFQVQGRADSHLPGPKGNREVFLWLAI